MQKWYKGKRKESFGERIKNFWVNKDTIGKALTVTVVITIIVTTISIIKRNKEASKETTTNIRIEESLDDASYLNNPKELVKVLCYKKG